METKVKRVGRFAGSWLALCINYSDLGGVLRHADVVCFVGDGGFGGLTRDFWVVFEENSFLGWRR